MRQLNGVYTQSSNHRHRRTGHVFQGRYKSVLVDGDAYSLELCRYIVLNPVRTGMIEEAGDWRWSSYGAIVGQGARLGRGGSERLRKDCLPSSPTSESKRYAATSDLLPLG